MFLSRIQSGETDSDFFNSRITLVSEENNLRIYEKINSFLETFDRITPFDYIMNQFYDITDPNIGSSYVYSCFYLCLTQYRELFVVDNHQVVKIDEDFKVYYEKKLLEFYAFVIEYSRIQNEKSNEEKEIDKTKLHDIINEMNRVSIKRKTSLKPYTKEEILTQDTCEVDYGNKKFTRQDIKNRQDYIKKTIIEANKLYEKQFEGQVIQRNFKDEKKKVSFAVAQDREVLISKLNGILK